MIGSLSESAIAHTGVVLLLVPADPLRPRRPDEHFAPEAAAARDAGHDVALIDHDALAEPDGAERAVARVPGGGGAAVYRGWMLAGAQYAALASALAAKGATMRTSVAQYQKAHELPGWYPALTPVTPDTAWTGVGEVPAVEARTDHGRDHPPHPLALARRRRGVDARLGVPGPDVLAGDCLDNRRSEPRAQPPLRVRVEFELWLSAAV